MKNRQWIKGFIKPAKSQVEKSVKKPKIPRKITYVDGVKFDSYTEAQFYRYLKDNKELLQIEHVVLQPEYELIEPFEVSCIPCKGSGRVRSSKRTGKTVQCSKCKGTGLQTRQGMKITPDFKIIYTDGFENVIDVKGGFTNESFSLRKKIFEQRYKIALSVVQYDKQKRKWVWK